MDEGILPAVYFFIGRSLDATLPQLGALTLCRAIVQVRAWGLSHHVWPSLTLSRGLAACLGRRRGRAME